MFSEKYGLGARGASPGELAHLGGAAVIAMTIYVLDTSAVTDPRLRLFFNAPSLNDVVYHLSVLLIKARIVLDIQFYMTPGTVRELRGFLERNGVAAENIDALLSIVNVKAPDLHDTRIPAHVMGRWIEEVQRRLHKGLRVAEEMVRRAAQGGYETGATGLSREALRSHVARTIHDLREKYREATRKGVVDTRVDFDAVMLARELGAVMVTNDEGIMRLCDDLGVRYIDPPRFVTQLTLLLRARGR